MAQPPGRELIDTASLADAEAAIERITGINELRYERAKAAQRDGQPSHHLTVKTSTGTPPRPPTGGPDYISLHRLAELIGAHTSPTTPH